MSFLIINQYPQSKKNNTDVPKLHIYTRKQVAGRDLGPVLKKSSLSLVCISSTMNWLQKQLHWWFPGVALKKCHWISIWALSLLPSPTGALKAACAGLSTKLCSWCAFTTLLFRMRNVKILHWLLFLLCARVCLGESLFCEGCCWVTVKQCKCYSSDSFFLHLLVNPFTVSPF